MAPTRVFCCCLPVRLGVFIITILNLLGGLFVAVVGWMQVSHTRSTPLPTVDEIALVLHSATFTVLAAVSLLGLIGAISKQRSLVSTLGMMMLAFLIISIGTGVYAIYCLFRNNGQVLVQACLAGDSTLGQDVCRTTANIVEAIVVTIYVVVWLLQLWGFFIVLDYCYQLDDEEQETLMPKYDAPPLAEKLTTTYDSFGPGAPPSGLRTGVSIPSPSMRRPNRSEV